MEEELIKQLEGKINKDEVVSLINKDKSVFEFYSKHITKNEPTSWKASWGLYHALCKDDKRITPYLTKIIKSIAGKSDGHQRELIKIVRKMKLSEREEGYFFDICVTLWEEIHKKPATRYNAVLFIIEMAKKHPEIKNELEHLTSDYYTQTLSQGIKRIFKRKLESLEKF